MAIAFDATANSAAVDGTSVSSVTYSHTVVSNTNGVIVVGASIYGGAAITGITYNSVALTSIGTNTQNSIHTELWYLKAPATGANNVVVTLDSAADHIVVGSVSLTGVDQTNPLDANTGASSGTSSISADITVVTDQSWIVDVVGNDLSSSTVTMGAQTNRTQRWNTLGTTFIWGAGSTRGPVSTGSNTMNWSSGHFDNWALTVASFAPAGAAASTVHRLLSLGVGI